MLRAAHEEELSELRERLSELSLKCTQQASSLHDSRQSNLSYAELKDAHATSVKTAEELRAEVCGRLHAACA